MTVREATPDDLADIGQLIRDLADYEHLAHEVVWTIEELGERLFGEGAVARVLIADAHPEHDAGFVPRAGAGSASGGGAGVPGADAPGAGTAGAGVAGFALWFPTFSTFLGRPGIWLEDLFVRPEHRGRGHGVALLTHLQRLAGDGRLEWAVLDWNEPSIAFYRSMGARPVEGWTRYRWLADEVMPPS